ncbi:MAG: SUMF1/EgtB/PvdO family nonheme iron enzyme [Bacteroidota bacterium]
MLGLKLSILCFCCGITNLSLSNGLRFTDLSLVSQQTLAVKVSWDNAWRFAPDTLTSNHDAVWIFVKYQTAAGQWLHASLDSLKPLGNHLLQASLPPDQAGAMVSLAFPFSGQVSAQPLSIRLQSPLPPDAVAVVVMGIEMVWVPEGPFWLGDTRSFHHIRDASDDGPLFVGDAGSIAPGQIDLGEEDSLAQAIPVSFPKGYRGFYLMKYELTQAQYRDFLNTLTFEQQQARTAADPAATAGTAALMPSPIANHRNGLVIASAGASGGPPARYACDGNLDGNHNQADDGLDWACSYLNWADLCAYLDWAGLRPLTELEFEKACRGPLFPQAREFAWGTSQIIDANTLVHPGLKDETVAEKASGSIGLGSHGYLGPQGPLRSGFGGNDSSNRLQMGAGYYGAAELSGNLWELCVRINSVGMSFLGEAGDGSLNLLGAADQADWPAANGAIHRGGAHNSGIFGDFRDLAVSDRFYFNLAPNQRRNTTGGRGGRSAW